jgi:hypothetical protein
VNPILIKVESFSFQNTKGTDKMQSEVMKLTDGKYSTKWVSPFWPR